MRHSVLTLLVVLAPSWAAGAVITPGDWTRPTAGAYWDGTSWDGPSLGIGDLLPGHSYWSADGRPTALTFDPGQVMFYLRDEIAGYAQLNRFGWFEVGGHESGEIFAGSDSRGALRVLDMATPWGLWLHSPAGFFTSTAHPEHFALFSWFSHAYILGMEDLLPRRWDADYNDLIVEIHVSRTPTPPEVQTPEPATLALVGAGLFAAGWRKRPRRRQGPTPGALERAQRVQDHFFDWGI